MAEPTNIPPRKQGLTGLFQGAGGWFAWIGDFIDSSYRKFQNLTQTNYDLGCALVARGKVSDAILRFRIALWITPEHLPSLYNLGCCYLHENKVEEAVQCFVRVIKLDPTNDPAKFMLSTVRPDMLAPEHRPQRTPPAMAAQDFDALAKFYNAQQRERKYALPILTYQLMLEQFPREAPMHDFTDLGCGTGLVGFQFAKLFQNLLGVDISARMLDEAYRLFDDRGVKIYSKLVHSDVRDYFADAKPESMDVVTAIALAEHYGELKSLFEGVGKILRPGGWFCLTFERYGQPSGFGMVATTRRFGHAVEYVEQLAFNAGLEQKRAGEVMAYPQFPVNLHIYRKRA